MTILNTIKEVIPIPFDCSDFDGELILLANTAFFALKEIGIGPEVPFKIDSDTETSEFECEEGQLDAAMSYVALKVRKAFDPPANATLMQSLDNTIHEIETRLQWNSDYGM